MHVRADRAAQQYVSADGSHRIAFAKVVNRFGGRCRHEDMLGIPNCGLPREAHHRAFGHYFEDPAGYEEKPPPRWVEDYNARQAAGEDDDRTLMRSNTAPYRPVRVVEPEVAPSGTDDSDESQRGSTGRTVESSGRWPDSGEYDPRAEEKEARNRHDRERRLFKRRLREAEGAKGIRGPRPKV